MKTERRLYQLRELVFSTRDDAEGLPTIEGYAAVFNEEVRIAGLFREQIMPGAFARAISEKQDVRALVNHNPSEVIGRTKSGTLALAEDSRGLKVTITPPDTQVGRDIVENLRVGNIDQMSFGFIAKQESWTDEADELPLRSVEDLDLFDVSAVTYPAYPTTDVGLRSAHDVVKEYLDSCDEARQPHRDYIARELARLRLMERE